MLCKLSVNINKIATLRNARGGQIPNVVDAAIAIQQFGADGITVHPRPDQRHIRYDDVYALAPIIKTEFNIEGYPDESFLQLVEKVNPSQVTLVPDAPDVLTSNAGWNTVKEQSFLKEVVARLKAKGIRLSLFLDPNPALLESAALTGTDRIELYTERYAIQYAHNPAFAVAPYKETAAEAMKCNLGVNAGHDLNLQNLRFFAENVPGLAEVSIGHALISDAIYFGLHNTVQMYKHKLIIHD
jgi:pyridoxine 5-phosphate synthase